MSVTKAFVAMVLVAVLSLGTAVFTYAGGDIFAITGFATSEPEVAIPADRIEESQIKVGEDSVVINIPNAIIGKFDDTNSMSPVIDKGANAILILPQTQADIQVGDIIAYHSEEAQGYVAHRAVQISADDQGWYAIARGDNADSTDPGRIRFDQIKYVVVGILY